MRLIDEADVVKAIDNHTQPDGTLDDDISCILEEVPTAFDKEKVIDKLEKLRVGYFLCIANTGDEKLDCAYENVGNALDKVFEIVEKGGIE